MPMHSLPALGRLVLGVSQPAAKDMDTIEWWLNSPPWPTQPSHLGKRNVTIARPSDPRLELSSASLPTMPIHTNLQGIYDYDKYRSYE